MQILKEGEISERFSLAPIYFAVYMLAVLVLVFMVVRVHSNLL